MTKLDNLQKDLLTEAFNIGIGTAAASLSEMVQSEIRLSVPYIRVMLKNDVANDIGQPTSTALSGVKQRFDGPFAGTALILFPEQRSLELVKLMLQDTLPQEDVTQYEQEALSEIGNVILNAGLSSLAELFQEQIETQLPEYTHGICSDILQVCSVTESADEHVLFLRVDFELQDRALKGYVIYIIDSLDDLIRQVDSYLRKLTG